MFAWKRHWYVPLVIVVFAVFTEQRTCAASTLTPPSTAAEWTLVPPPDCHTPSSAERRLFDGVRAARRICRAQYTGTPTITLTLYDLPGGPAATAFDAFQQWRTQPSRMGFFRGGVFGVAEAPEADKKALNRFVVTLEAGLPPGNESRR
jgi:hypothetical protein